MSNPRCRFCQAPLRTSFVDLGMAPLANAFVPADAAHQAEVFYPLHAWVCERCFLVQLEAMAAPETIFTEYAYFSSFSEAWLAHARDYAAMMQRRFALPPDARVVEVASNDGYLLQYFKKAGFPVLGIEPAANVARVAEEKGIPTVPRFFGQRLAEELAAQEQTADLLIANNVLAHVPDLNDFARGLRTVLSPSGVLTLEFPHLLALMREVQFDTIYHEHFSYFSFATARAVLQAHGLRVFDVERLSTHGGSLRLYVCHPEAPYAETPAGNNLLAEEEQAGLQVLATYGDFGQRVQALKWEILDFLIRVRREGKRVAAYGAPAKGNTLFNFCGVRPDLIAFTVDRNPHKQGTLLPGTRLPVRAPEAVFQEKPDYLIILPWNLRDEIAAQMAGIRDWGGQFVTLIPSVSVF